MPTFERQLCSRRSVCAFACTHRGAGERNALYVAGEIARQYLNRHIASCRQQHRVDTRGYRRIQRHYLAARAFRQLCEEGSVLASHIEQYLDEVVGQREGVDTG